MEDILNGGSHFLVDDVRDRCAYYMVTNTGFHNALRLWALADLYNLTSVAALCQIVVSGRFHDFLFFHPDTLEMPAPFLQKLITEGVLKAVSVATIAEFLSKWVKHDVENRLARLQDMIENPIIRNALDFPDESKDHSILSWLDSITPTPLPPGGYLEAVLVTSEVRSLFQVHAYIPDQKRWVCLGSLKRSMNSLFHHFEGVLGFCDKKIVITYNVDVYGEDLSMREVRVVLVDFEAQSSITVSSPQRCNASVVKHFCFDGKLFCLVDERVKVSRKTSKRHKMKAPAYTPPAFTPPLYRYIRQLNIWDGVQMIWKPCCDIPLPPRSSQQLQEFFTIELGGDVYVWSCPYKDWCSPQTDPFFLVIRKQGTRYCMSRLASPPVEGVDFYKVEMGIDNSGCIILWKNLPHWSMVHDSVFQLCYDPTKNSWKTLWGHRVPFPRNDLLSVSTKPRHCLNSHTLHSTFLNISNVKEVYVVDSSYRMLPTFSRYNTERNTWENLPSPPLPPIVGLYLCRVPSDLLSDASSSQYIDNSQEIGFSPFYELVRKNKSKGWTVSRGDVYSFSENGSSSSGDSNGWDDFGTSSESCDSDLYFAF